MNFMSFQQELWNTETRPMIRKGSVKWNLVPCVKKAAASGIRCNSVVVKICLSVFPFDVWND